VRPEIDQFIEEARGVSIAEAAARLGLIFKKSGTEHPQPCPATGGDDRFSFNTTKNSWNCRGCGVGGRDAIGMAAHVLGHDVKSREGLLESCSAVLARPIPEEGERESEEDRAARLARLEGQRRKNAAEAEKRERVQLDFREKERRKARGIYEAAGPLVWSAASDYLRLRGAASPGDPWLRFSAEVTYWYGQDERGQPVALHSGPAMIAPFIVPLSVSPSRSRARLDTSPPEGGEERLATAEGRASDRMPGRMARPAGAARAGGEEQPREAVEYQIIGCHITWIDLERPPKFRPLLADPATGELLPTKKMRGSKKGGVIPLAGDPSARRWLGGEGIENTLAFARWEGFRADTFYFAAGDLGNLAGPADPKSRFAHPELKQPDRNGVLRAVMVAGPVPLFSASRATGPEPVLGLAEGKTRGAPRSGGASGEPDGGQSPARPAVDHADCMVVPDHVDELVLLADGDSERVMTAAAMVRAKKRHARPGRLIPVVWPGRPGSGVDFASLMADAAALEEA
jgi:hypothetical protein